MIAVRVFLPAGVAKIVRTTKAQRHEGESGDKPKSPGNRPLISDL